MRSLSTINLIGKKEKPVTCVQMAHVGIGSYNFVHI